MIVGSKPFEKTMMLDFIVIEEDFALSLPQDQRRSNIQSLPSTPILSKRHCKSREGRDHRIAKGY